MRSFILASLLLIAGPAFAETDPRSGSNSPPNTGAEATIPTARQAGGYNNYCQTWRDARAKDRALFGACLAND